MEEIIGLLVIVAIAIFKGVSKKLEQSGTNPSAPVRPTTANEPEPQPFDLAKWLSEQMAQQPEQEPAIEPEPEPEPEPEAKPQVVRRTVDKPVEEPVKQKEKIDPKKLIIYSEIMNPKCNE